MILKVKGGNPGSAALPPFGVSLTYKLLESQFVRLQFPVKFDEVCSYECLKFFRFFRIIARNAKTYNSSKFIFIDMVADYSKPTCFILDIYNERSSSIFPILNFAVLSIVSSINLHLVNVVVFSIFNESYCGSVKSSLIL